MTLTYGFYNSLNHDRKYNASQLSKLFEGILNDGIFKTVGDGLAVTAGAGMTVNVGTGRAWFNNTWTNNDAALPLAIAAAEAILNRIDLVVLEVGSSADVRANSIKIIKGTPASVPAEPALVKTTGQYQYPLAAIYVAAGAASITAGNITNKIGTTDCPYSTVIGAAAGLSGDITAHWHSEDRKFSNITGKPTTLAGYGITDSYSASLYPAKVATTANITLSATQTIDGVAVVAGDVVLVKNQTDAKQNGLYTVAAGAWIRYSKADTIAELAACIVLVLAGTTNGGGIFKCNNKSTQVLGTDLIVFERMHDSSVPLSVSGTYIGKGTYNVSNTQNRTTITLGFKPSVIILVGKYSGETNATRYLVFVSEDHDVGYALSQSFGSTISGTGIEFTNTGFITDYYGWAFNVSGEEYLYTAFR